MNSHDPYEPLLARLTPFGQQHLLRGWNQLGPAERQTLANQIDSLDLPLLQRLFQERETFKLSDAELARCQPPGLIRWLAEAIDPDLQAARRRGEEALRQQKIGVLLVAGGQGTRLGIPYPKGMLPLAPISGRTLFQIHVDRLRAMQRKYARSIPLYLMTSPATHHETVRYFEEHEYLGLDRNQISFFMQGTMPALDAQTGEILLEAPHRMAVSPDGHGGTLAALARANLLDQMKDRGIEHLFYFQVDNPMVSVADPTFMGIHLSADSEMTTQVVPKQDPSEKVGIVVNLDGALRILEYSDMPASMSRARDTSGHLKWRAGSIAVHAMRVDFLRRMAGEPLALPFHRAHKRVSYLDGSGNVVVPREPNAIKFERFIFDILPHASNAIVVEVDRADAFAPVKNEAGAASDSPETACAALVDQHRRWLTLAGAVVQPATRVEIHPLFALDAEELRQRISAGVNVDVDTYFR